MTARTWRPEPLGGLLTRLGSHRGQPPVPRAFRRDSGGAIPFRRSTGTIGRASYWCALSASRVWAVDTVTRAFVALELHVSRSDGTWARWTDSWDSAVGVSWEAREWCPR